MEFVLMQIGIYIHLLGSIIFGFEVLNIGKYFGMAQKRQVDNDFCLSIKTMLIINILSTTKEQTVVLSVE